MRHARMLALFAIVFAGLLATGGIARADSSRELPVIISFRAQPTSGQLRDIESLGSRIHRRYRSIPAVSARVPRSALAALRARPGIARVDIDSVVTAVDDPVAAVQTVPWGVDRIGAREVVPGATGAGVRVAVIDTGVDIDHPDLNVAAGESFVEGVASYDDDNGHGTHVAGSIAALDNGIGVVGVAPDASLLIAKVLDYRGSGYWSDVIAGIEWAVDNDADVINMSLGARSTPPFAVRMAVEAAYDAGVVLVAAAGNSGSRFGFGSNVIWPAKYGDVIAVAATDSDDERASFSSTGVEVELAAPGVRIESTLPPGGYGEMSGTSMASPHVAGVVALLLSSGTLTDLNGDSVVDQSDVRLRLRDTAVDLGDPGFDMLYGYGLVDAAAAILAPVPNRPPTADAGGPYTGSQGVPVTFSGAGSFDPDGDPLAYSWAFGDGATGAGVSPSHTYAAGGVYTVTLTVDDGRGEVDVDSTTATISGTNQPPVADAGGDKTGTVGVPVTFSGAGSFDPDGTIVSYEWDFGDGSAGAGAVASHTYSAAGTFTATLTVTDNVGATGSDTATVTVLEPATQTMHIDDVSVVLRSKFFGWKTWAEATVRVVDASGDPVASVGVSSEWSGATTGTRTKVTNSAGLATFRSRVLRRPLPGTTFVFRVTELRKSGWVYDAAADVETGGSVTVR